MARGKQFKVELVVIEKGRCEHLRGSVFGFRGIKAIYKPRGIERNFCSQAAVGDHITLTRGPAHLLTRTTITRVK